MSVRMKKELIEGGMQLRAAPQQFAVEAEAALPGGLRDEVRLFYTEAQAEPAQAEAVGNRLTVSGRVNFRALRSDARALRRGQRRFFPRPDHHARRGQRGLYASLRDYQRDRAGV